MGAGGREEWVKLTKVSLLTNTPFHITMDQALGMVDSVKEVKCICDLISNTETHIPRKRYIPSPVETVAQRPILHVFIDKARSMSIIAIGNQ